MYRELEASKFVCNGCGKVIKVNTFEDIIKFEKKCADCRLIDVTGGVKEVKPKTSKSKPILNSKHSSFDSLKREDKKKNKKKPMSSKQKENNRIKWELKWDRECYGRRNLSE